MQKKEQKKKKKKEKKFAGSFIKTDVRHTMAWKSRTGTDPSGVVPNEPREGGSINNLRD
mgnify:CR=1 FL=1